MRVGVPVTVIVGVGVVVGMDVTVGVGVAVGVGVGVPEGVLTQPETTNAKTTDTTRYTILPLNIV